MKTVQRILVRGRGTFGIPSRHIFSFYGTMMMIYTPILFMSIYICTPVLLCFFLRFLLQFLDFYTLRSSNQVIYAHSLDIG